MDGDIIAYKAAFVSTEKWDDETELFDPAAVEANVKKMITEWGQLAKAGTSIICLSDVDHRYFRHTVYPDYKGNRDDRKRPAALSCAFEVIEKHCKTVRYEGLEADDVMGVLSGSEHLSDPVIVSIDKDMLTIPGKILNPNKFRRPIKVSKQAADRMMLKQALQGDRTDNYFGVEGIGPVKADKIVDAHADIRKAWEAVVETFGDEEQALTMCRLSRILRPNEYNEEKGEVRLWHPTKQDIWIPSKPSAEKTKSIARSSSTTPKNASRKTATKRTGSRKKTTKISPVAGP
jgi:DNA polymerase-1